MFSSTQLDMLQPLVEAYYAQGYTYYLVHTNTNIGISYNNYDFIDLEFYFSKDPIIQDGYNFECNSESVYVQAITRNVSNNQSDSKLPRIQTQKIANFETYINPYEHIMTNADGNLAFMDIMGTQEYDNNHNIAYNVDLNYMYSIPIILSIAIILSWLKIWFARNYGGKYEKD